MCSTYQTYLFDCECPSARRILFKNLIPYCAWCRKPLVKASLMDYEEEHFPKEKQIDEEMRREYEAKECLDNKEKEKWQLMITRVQNGYIIEVPNQPPYVIQESENDELKEHEQLLYRVMEYFDFQGSKHDLERLRIVREKYRRNKK